MTKLQGLSGISVIYEEPTKELVSFPAILFTGFTSEDRNLDSRSNLRTYTFPIVVYQTTKGLTSRQVEDVLINLVDTLNNAFLSDFTLSGSCLNCIVKNGTKWYDKESEMRGLFLELLVETQVTF